MIDPLTDEGLEKVKAMRKRFDMPTVEEFDSLIATVDELKTSNKQLQVCQDFMGSHDQRMLDYNAQLKEENEKLKAELSRATMQNILYTLDQHFKDMCDMTKEEAEVHYQAIMECFE